MSAHVIELLPAYLLGELPQAEQLPVFGHLLMCPDCAREASALRDDLGLIALAEAPVAPSPQARLRLMQATRPVQPLTLTAHADKAAKFFDLPADKARKILEKACNPAAWSPAAVPGLSLFELIPGPAWAQSDAGLIRFEPNVSFPHHTHMGEERVLMLEGGIRFADGSEQHAGDEVIMPAGSSHAFTVLPEGATYGLILHQGVIVDGFGPYPNSAKRVP